MIPPYFFDPAGKPVELTKFDLPSLFVRASRSRFHPAQICRKDRPSAARITVFQRAPIKALHLANGLPERG
jgi:hypothetical protein